MAYLVDMSANGARVKRAGRAMGLGDDAPLVPRDPIVDLIAQVNRFTRAGQFGGKIYPLVVVSGNLTPDVARTAIIIHQTRLLVAQAGITDTGTALELTKAAKGLADPVNFVAGNLASITKSIAGYADLKGMPAADYHADGGPVDAGGMSPTVIAVGLGALVIGWLVLTHATTRRPSGRAR